MNEIGLEAIHVQEINQFFQFTQAMRIQMDEYNEFLDTIAPSL